MPFREKTALIMSVALMLGGLFYFRSVASMSENVGELAQPTLRLLIVYTVILVVVAIVGHIVTAALAPKEANADADERERRIFERAGHWSGYVFGAGILPSLAAYLWTQDGNLLFYCVFASLMLSQVAEYLFQIVLYRTAMR